MSRKNLFTAKQSFSGNDETVRGGYRSGILRKQKTGQVMKQCSSPALKTIHLFECLLSALFAFDEHHYEHGDRRENN